MTDVSKLATKKFNHDTVPLRTDVFASTSKLNISKKKLFVPIAQRIIAF